MAFADYPPRRVNFMRIVERTAARELAQIHASDHPFGSIREVGALMILTPAAVCPKRLGFEENVAAAKLKLTLEEWNAVNALATGCPHDIIVRACSGNPKPPQLFQSHVDATVVCLIFLQLQPTISVEGGEPRSKAPSENHKSTKEA